MLPLAYLHLLQKFEALKQANLFKDLILTLTKSIKI